MTKKRTSRSPVEAPASFHHDDASMLVLSDDRRASLACSLRSGVAFLEKRLAQVPATWDDREHQLTEANVTLEQTLREVAGLFPDDLCKLLISLCNLRSSIVLRSLGSAPDDGFDPFLDIDDLP